MAGALIWGGMIWSCLALTVMGQSSVTVFGPRRYDRLPGPPRNVVEQFTAPSGGTLLNYDLQIQNGAPDGPGRVTGATIQLNGEALVRGGDLTRGVASLTRPAIPLANNTLTIRVVGEPGSFITVTLTGTPVTNKSLRVVPAMASTSPGRTLLLAAEITGLNDRRVAWSVNNVAGGNSTVGTISPAGLYVAPPVAAGQTSQFTIRATSVADASLFGESLVKVLGQDTGNEFIASAVSVRYDLPPRPTPAYVSAPVSVRYDTPKPPISAYVTAPVSVRYDTPKPPISAYVTAPVSVRYDSPLPQQPVPTFAAVSVTQGPAISTVAPATINRGATATLTINGANFSGATTVKLTDPQGVTDANITISNLTVNAGGTALTATIAVNANAALGRRIVLVTTAAGNTMRNDANTNVITIQ